MSVQESLAVLTALDVTRTVLGAQMPTKCIVYEAVEAGLELPPPEVYGLALSRQAVDEALKNASVACFVFQSRPSDVEDPTNSGTPMYRAGIQTTYIEIRVVYRSKLQRPYTPAAWGSKLSSQDILARRGYWYAAAVNDVLRAHLCCDSGGAITSIVSKDSDYAGSIFETDSTKIYGMATLVYGVRQDTLIPFCGA